MAGDTRLFQEALKRGSAHAWNEQWDKAADEYRRALLESPEDVSARTYLAMALYKSGRHQESLDLYQSLWNSQPSNLTMLQRVAELQEAVGDANAASASYGRLADAHTRRGATKEAFKAWQKLVELTPGNPILWNSLIQVAVQVGTVAEIIPGYLGFARDLALQSKFQEAIQIAERAQSLDPSSPLVLPMLSAIRKGIEYSFRAASFGEEVYPEDLARYIPSIDVLESRLHEDSTPGVIIDATPGARFVPVMPASAPGIDYDSQQLARAVEAGQKMFEVLFRPTSEWTDRGISIDSVRDNLTKYGNVVDVRPEVEARGGVVFIIMLSSSLDEGSIQSAIERSLPGAGHAHRDRPRTRGIPMPPPRVEVRRASSDPRGPIPLGGMTPGTLPRQVPPPVEKEPVTPAMPEPEAEQPEALSADAAAVPGEPEVEVAAEAPEEAPEETPFGYEGVLEPEAEGAADEIPTGEPETEPEAMPETAQFESLAEAEGETPGGEEPQFVEISWEEFEALTSGETEVEPEGEDETTLEPEQEPSEPEAEQEPSELEPAAGLADMETVQLVTEQQPPNGHATTGLEDLEPIETSTDQAEEIPEAQEESAPSAAAEVEEVGHDQPELVRQAEAARESGSLLEALALYERVLSLWPATAQHLVDLGELHEQVGNRAEAAQAFAQALTLSENLPQAMLGLARVELAGHRLDQAETQARKALQASLPDYPEAEAWAADLLIDIARERAAYGDLGGTAEGLAWLQATRVIERMPLPIAGRIDATPRELLAQSMAEHLEEIASLPKQARGEVATALSRSEQLLEEQKLRTAADEMYQLISLYPDFLPAQSMLGRLEVARGLAMQAAERSRRLLELYRLRGTEDQSVEVLRWMRDAGLATADECRLMATLVRQQGSVAEAERIEEEIEARARAEDERRSLEERARLVAQEEARRAAEEAARRAAEAAARKAAEDAARRAAAEEAVRRAVEEIGRKTAEEQAAQEEAALPAPPQEQPVSDADVYDQLGSETKQPEGGLAVEPPVEEEPPKDDTRQKGGLRGMLRALRGGRQKDVEKASDQGAPAGMEISSDVMARDAQLRLAESKYGFGDTKGAAQFIRSALNDERISTDMATRVALLRVLQIASPDEDGLRDVLVEILSTLGLPEEFAN